MNFFPQIKQKILNPNNYGFVLILFIILLLPNLFVTFFASDLSGSILKKGAYLLFSILILIVPTLFLKLRWYFIFESIFMFFAPFEIGYVILSKSTITDGYIAAILNTNFGEASELLLTMKWQIFILLIIWICYFYIVLKKIKNNFLFKKNFSIAVGITFILSNILLFGAMYGIEYTVAKEDVRISAVIENFTKKYRKTYPCNLILILQRTYENYCIVNDMKKNIASFSFYAKQTVQPHEKELYILVIGESARYGNFSLNGYTRETSPLLDKRNDLLTFSDVYSTSNITGYALPLLLSRATPLNINDAYKEKTFVDAFQECGFYTAWIANQSSYYPYIKRIAKDANEAHFSNSDFDAAHNYDGLLLKYVDHVLNQNNKKTFIVFHTLGSHFRFNSRYPKEFEKFTPALKSTSDYSYLSKENKTVLVNAYDNSILYTDFILSEIINKAEAENCISAVMYISDHAENLYDEDGDNSLIMHGTKNPPEKEIHIPLFIWTSPQYKQIYENKQKSMEANKNKKISSSNIFYSILDMAGISFPGQQLEKSIACDLFKEDSIRHVYTPNNEVINFQ